MLEYRIEGEGDPPPSAGFAVCHLPRFAVEERGRGKMIGLSSTAKRGRWIAPQVRDGGGLSIRPSHNFSGIAQAIVYLVQNTFQVFVHIFILHTENVPSLFAQ